MAATSKILWTVGYGSAANFLAVAKAAKVTGVAIRSDNNLAKAIPLFHDEGIKVFGWRWPSARHDAAMNEATKIAALLHAGLDGYFVDPEGEPGKPYDWDQAGLGPIADEFCQRIVGAADGKRFGVTSHYRAKAVFPKLPWATFFQYADVLLPQSYWRTDGGTIGHGIPADNYDRGIEYWAAAGGDKARIVPMAGELASVTAAEIRQYCAEAARLGVDELHFYTAEDGVKPAVWDAVAAA